MQQARFPFATSLAASAMLGVLAVAAPVLAQTAPSLVYGPVLEPRRPLPPESARRHPAWQAAGPMAPRPLSPVPSPSTSTSTSTSTASGDGAAPARTPSPSAPPEPVVPSSRPLTGCMGNTCLDAAGATYNGIGGGIGSGNAGVSSSGRLCMRSGATVQCF